MTTLQSSVVLTNEDLSGGKMRVVDLLIRAGFATTEADARELIKRRTVELDGSEVSHDTSISRGMVSNDDGEVRLSVHVTVQLPPGRTVAELLDTLPFRKRRSPRVVLDLPDDGDDLSLAIPSSKRPR